VALTWYIKELNKKWNKMGSLRDLDGKVMFHKSVLMQKEFSFNFLIENLKKSTKTMSYLINFRTSMLKQ